ncbi:MAG TPA: FAD-binding oxidoreductase [Polyangiaceae bacterium]|nr:FAD-binding oxidoreductase [Polyangiaceae bacterium]
MDTQAAAARHAAKVARIADALRRCPADRPVSIKKRGVSHQVPKRRDLRRQDQRIDVSDLDEILEIDPVQRLAVAESGVTFVDLVAATLKHGLLPIVVPELKTITIGGAVAGCSIESTSFINGGFHDTALEYEVITSDGRVLVCRPENENALAFHMQHGAFGTLGILSKLKFRLMPAKPYVHVTYEKHPTLALYMAAIRRHFEARDVDFMDGIIHSPELYVLSLGRFVDRAPYTHRYDWMRIYYESTRTRSEDYLRAEHYLFRYDRGVTNVRPRSLLGRALFGKLLASTEWLWLAAKLPFLLRGKRPTITLDMFVPFSRTPEFMRWYDENLGHYPIWCVPYRRVHDYEWLSPSFWSGLGDEQLFLDLAVYGMRQHGPVNHHRLVERELAQIGGLKTLISHNYYEPHEFWSTWNRENYDRVRSSTDPRHLFRDVYAQTCRAAMGRDSGTEVAVARQP